MGENVIKSDSKEDIKYKMYSSLWLIKKHTQKKTLKLKLNRDVIRDYVSFLYLKAS